MSFRTLLAILLTVGISASAFAAAPPNPEESVQVTVKGVLHEDKDGFFIQADGTIFDLLFAETNRADMHKFHSDLKGDQVRVSGAFHVQEVPNAKTHYVVYANDIVRVKSEVPVVERRDVVVEQPVVVRERWVEPRRGINLPGIHINW